MIPIVVIHLRGTSFSLSEYKVSPAKFKLNCLTLFLVGSMSVCFLYSILFMKLWSYVQVNLWCRSSQKQQKSSISGKRRESFSLDRRRESDDMNGNMPNGYKDHPAPTLVQYPDNLSLQDLFYFLLAPTLCYELNFPRTSRIRKRFLIKRILELIVGVNIVMALFQQVKDYLNCIVLLSHPFAFYIVDDSVSSELADTIFQHGIYQSHRETT